MGGFQFQKSRRKMVRPNVPFSEDEIFPNRIDSNTVEKSSRGIPFKGGQKMHVSTLRAPIHLCTPPNSLVVTMNSSIGRSF